MGRHHVSLDITFLIYKISSHVSFPGFVLTRKDNVSTRLPVDAWCMVAVVWGAGGAVNDCIAKLARIC